MVHGINGLTVLRGLSMSRLMVMIVWMTIIKTMMVIMMVMIINLKSEQLVDLLTNVVQVAVDPSQDVQLGKVRAS